MARALLDLDAGFLERVLQERDPGLHGLRVAHRVLDGASAPIVSVVDLPDMRLEAVELVDGRTLDVDGVFILREAVAPSSLVKGLEIDGADIVVDRGMRTNKPGVFAAGDCTGRPYQITKATGEGNIAAHSIIEYLSEMEKEA